MFSGLTNQVTSWIGKKQDGDVPKEEEVPPVAEPTPELNDSTVVEDEVKKEDSPTKAGRGLDMLGNIGQIGGSVKNQFGQMSSWLGGGIPGLSRGKGGEGTSPPESTPPQAQPPASAPEKEKDDDASSATGGADSDAPLSADASPTDEQATQLGNVSTKAVAGAKTFGNMIFSGFTKASKTVTEAGAKIKKRVEETSILGELNRDQEAFIKEKNSKGAGPSVPPWVGRPNEEALKNECLSLSTDRRNFVRAPPPGVDFQFDFEQVQPIAMATLAEDPNLEKMRFELVPKVINEENFWRNYFYRLSLICQANEVSSLDATGGSGDRTSSLSKDSAVAASSGDAGDLSPTQEFVSDSFTASSADIEEVKEGMRKLGITTAAQEEEWEKELEAELDNYEMIGHEPSDKNLSVQIENMLDNSDIEDLK